MSSDRTREVARCALEWKRGQENAERRLAEALELWIAELLATDPRWVPQGRWFDGLVFESCHAVDDDGFAFTGWIWRVDTQTRYPFEARLAISRDDVETFEVRVGQEIAATQRKRRLSEDAWVFRG